MKGRKIELYNALLHALWTTQINTFPLMKPPFVTSFILMNPLDVHRSEAKCISIVLLASWMLAFRTSTNSEYVQLSKKSLVTH